MSFQDIGSSDDGWQIVFHSRSRQACADRGLVLTSLGIPHEVLHEERRSMLVVPAEFTEKAKYELWQYETENSRPSRRHRRVLPYYQNAAWGVAAYIAVLSIVAVLAGEAAFNQDWYAAGRVDGVLIRQGEWWRTVTALTLHGSLGHFLGNVGFGALFGFMAGRVLGPGVTWLAVVISSGLANFVNTLLLDATHRAIGASTAVFAALGLVSGFSWRAQLFDQDRWAYRAGPVVGGIALLAFTGTGDATTDIGAHLAGFVCGFLCGTALTLVYRCIADQRIQTISAIAAIAIVAGAWISAL